MPVRHMFPEDFRQVVDLDIKSGGSLDEKQLYDCLGCKEIIGLVYETPLIEGKIIRGFALYEIREKSLNLFYLMVDSDHRRMDIGSQIVDYIKDRLRFGNRRIKVHARESALPVQLFLKHNGFVAYEVRRRFFPDTKEDAYMMRFGDRQMAEAKDRVFSEGGR